MTHPTVKGIRIAADKTVTDIELNSLEDYQAAVVGMIEPITLSDGTTMYVNEEYRYQFTNDDVNWMAGDIAASMGSPHFLFDPILGPVVVVGPLDDEGYDTDITAKARRVIKKVGNEAGAKVVA